MMQTKQISIWIIALVGLMTVTNAAQAGDYNFKHGGVYYKKNGMSGTFRAAKVVPEKVSYPYYSDSNQPMGAVTIPKSFTQGHIHTVKEIGDDAFYGCKGIMSVTIPSRVSGHSPYYL